IVNVPNASQLLEYSVDVIGTGASVPLTFDLNGPLGIFLDDVTLIAVGPQTIPAQQTASGSITFADPDLTDQHTIAVTPQGGGIGYLGTFTPVLADSTGTGNGAVNWTFSVDNSAIQYLRAGQSLVQTYTVTID